MELNELDKTLEMLKVLLKEGKTPISDLQQKLKLDEKDFTTLVYVLEYVGIIRIQNKAVSLSSQSYSILFEPLLIHEGTEQFVRETLERGRTFDKEQLQIPAMLVPILLLRSMIPYFGLILRDIEKDNEFRLNKQQKEFLYDFFSPFKFAYKDYIEKWKNSPFSADEFYDLWLTINRRLSTIIQTKSKYPVYIAEEKSSEKPKFSKRKIPRIRKKTKIARIPDSEKHEIDQRFYNIPQEALQAFFRGDDRNKGRVIYEHSNYPKNNLRQLINIDIDLHKIRAYVPQVEKSKGQITLTNYENGILKWEYLDEKGKVPSLFLTSEGIYGNKENLKQFSEKRIEHQTGYLLTLIKRISGETSSAKEG